MVEAVGEVPTSSLKIADWSAAATAQLDRHGGVCRTDTVSWGFTHDCFYLANDARRVVLPCAFEPARVVDAGAESGQVKASEIGSSGVAVSRLNPRCSMLDAGLTNQIEMPGWQERVGLSSGAFIVCQPFAVPRQRSRPGKRVQHRA